MPTDFVVRSTTHSDGSEYGSMTSPAEGLNHDFIPDHYVRRLWRKKALLQQHGTIVTFTNKDTVDRRVTNSAVQISGVLLIQEGNGQIPSRPEAEIARVEWCPTAGKSITKCPITIGTKTTLVKDVLKRSSPFSDTRVFTGPDGIEYRWKAETAGPNPLYPDSTFRTLVAKDSKHPVATTERLVNRDGDYNDDSYPVYISERGLPIQNWIVATLVMLECL